MELETLAATALKEGNYTCVVAYGGAVVFSSKERGVKPLVEYYRRHGKAHPGAAMADKVIGRAAALLVQLTGVTSVYGDIMSEPAEDALAAAGITARYGTLVPGIRNRQGTGPCPMEELSKGADTPQEMLTRVEEFLKTLPQG